MIVMKPKPGYTPDSDRYRDLIDEVIEPELRRVEGTGRFFTGGRNGKWRCLLIPNSDQPQP